MPTHETGKQRAARIPLDYFRRSNPLERWKLRLAVAALVLSVAWWASGFLRADRGQLRYSRGPLAEVHAMWEANCTACHEPFSPIDGRSLAARLTGSPSAGSQQCEACHAGPRHHLNENPEHVLSCAGCHREHRGRDASLVRLPDEFCTRCHASLQRHMLTGAPTVEFADVSSFSGDHPEFRVLRSARSGGTYGDPGKLKFNHATHMTPGMVLAADGKPFTLADVRDQIARDRYRQPGPQNDGPVQLECRSCHEDDAGDFGAKGTGSLSRTGAGATRISGGYMLPVRYKLHCRACHPLTFDPDMSELEAPHGMQPHELRKFLENTYAREYLADNPQLLDRPVAARPVPGRTSDASQRTWRMQIDGRVEQASKILFDAKTACGECHEFKYSVAARGPAMSPGGDHFEHLTQFAVDGILPTSVPEVWFQHAVFDHAAHRAITCRECHERAFPDSRGSSSESSDILLPGIATCRKCHGPAGRSGSVERGGARFDCTECHRYHNGDQPLHGIGAAARDGRASFSAAEFLRGTIREQPTPKP